MFIIRLLLFSSGFVTILASIRISDLDIKIYDDSSFEQGINDALAGAKRLKQMGTTLSYGAKVATMVPYASTVVNGLSSVLSSEGERAWKEDLIKSIASEADRAIALSKIDDIKARMEVIAQHFRSLNQQHLSDDSKRSIVHNINNDISWIIKLFTDEHSIFKRHPLLVIAPLATLASIVGTFEPIVEIFEPQFARQLFLSCKVLDILLEYRLLAVYQRLDLTDLYEKSSAGFYGTIGHKQPDMTFRKCAAIARTFNPNGYAQSNSGNIECDRQSCDDLDYDHFCFTDKVAKKHFDAGDHRQVDQCVVGYLEVARHRVEQAFVKPLELMQGACTVDRQGQRSETGIT